MIVRERHVPGGVRSVEGDGLVVPTPGFVELFVLRVHVAQINVPRVLSLGADGDRKFGQPYQIRFVPLKKLRASIQLDQPLVARKSPLAAATALLYQPSAALRSFFCSQMSPMPT